MPVDKSRVFKHYSFSWTVLHVVLDCHLQNNSGPSLFQSRSIEDIGNDPDKLFTFYFVKC